MMYRLNVPRFAAESFAGEVVILDIDGGIYYSLEGAAAWIYRELADGASVDQLLAACPPPLAQEAGSVVERLIGEQILTGTGGEGRAPAQPPPDDALPLRMTRYDDLQLLLQIDPVHDVDATGWPNPPSS